MTIERETRHTSRFTAYDAAGNAHTIDEYTEFVRVRLASGAFEPWQTHMRTLLSGDTPVNEMERGVAYELVTRTPTSLTVARPA